MRSYLDAIEGAPYTAHRPTTPVRYVLAALRPLAQPNYVDNLRELGFTDDDLTPPGGSDALVDALVAWGTSTRSSDGSGPTSTPAPTTSPSRYCPRRNAACPTNNGGSSPRRCAS